MNQLNLLLIPEDVQPCEKTLVEPVVVRPSELRKKNHKPEPEPEPEPGPDPEQLAEWDYIVDEASWNTSYEGGVLKEYYAWADTVGAYPYKEDLWNEAEQRAANWNDIVGVAETGEPQEFEDGYHYVDRDGNPCVRCWKGAINAPGAKYPWAAVSLPKPFTGVVKFVYDEGEPVYPWGSESKEFTKGFGVASIPTELGEEFLLDSEGSTTFDDSKLKITLE